MIFHAEFGVQTTNLRSATSADAVVLRHWDQQPHVWASDPNDNWAWEVELSKVPDVREQLIAEHDGRPIGFIQIIDPAREESHYWGDIPSGLRARLPGYAVANRIE
jgi:aminoglycoside 6'-N-acetyltransferase